MENRGLVKLIVLSLLCLAIHVMTAQGQTLYSKDAKITVSAHTVITVKGSVENLGTLTNNGHLKVGGPWVNAGTYHAGTGQITFNSTSATTPQIIHHNGQSFNTVTVAGGTKKIILSDMVIGKEIRFVDGVIEASGISQIIFDQGVNISGASDSSHIHARLYQRGDGPKLFPVGNGLIYLPVELTDVGDASALIGIQGFEYENLTLAKSPSLQSISDIRYWHIDVVSGSLTDSQIILPLRDESWISDPGRIVVVQSPSPTQNFVSIGGWYVEGEVVSGRVASKGEVSMPFVALATAAVEKKLIVYNAVSPNGDDLNDYLRIENIENYPANRFSLYNRWGDKVFETANYDNGERAFKGRGNIHGDSELVSGTYFYVLDLPEGESLRGFVAVKN